MSTNIETRADAWKRRAGLTGEVDFTMMYVAHDAFNRDMSRLLNAANVGDGLTDAAISTWRFLARQLHTHHRAEDTALWPRLAAVVTDEAERHILAAMETEHASLDPGIDRIDAAISNRDHAVLADELAMLGDGLSAHMIHEEADALPLLERRLGRAGWEAFAREIRDQQGGIRGAADYLPWVLEGADDEVRSKILHLLPAPVRMLYKRRWEPGYRRSGRLR